MKTRIGSAVRVPFYFLLISCLILVSVIPANHSLSRVLPIDPALRGLLSQADRGDAMSVIVQETTIGDDAEALVESLGGEVVHSWTIIPAFLANLSADAIVRLAQSRLVRYISWNGPMQGQVSGETATAVFPSSNVYPTVVGAPIVWASGITGKGVTVAVLDSGVTSKTDFSTAKKPIKTRILYDKNFGSVMHLLNINVSMTPNDLFGHGTHVAGIIGSNGVTSLGKYIGVAPEVNFINLRVSDLQGMAYEADMLSALEWVYTNREEYKIRVINVSMNSASPLPYLVSPLDAALEVLWFNGIVVVVSAGNNGSTSGILYPPANDPFFITVGASDDRGTAGTRDDIVAPFSAYGSTMEGIAKPDLVAPGAHIVNLLASTDCTMAVDHPEAVLDSSFLMLSGTSMSAAVTSGAVALLLQKYASLNPDQVKWVLKNSTTPLGQAGAGTGILNVGKAMTIASNPDSANTGTMVSILLQPIATVNWGSVNWGSVNWGSVNWGSVNWGSVNWGSVNWGSVNWGY